MTKFIQMGPPIEAWNNFIVSNKKRREVSMTSQISKTSTVAAAKDRIWCDMAGEAVILNLDSGVYYGLNPVGAQVWKLIQEPKAVSDLLATLLETYDVAAERCETDLFSLLQDLAVNELIVIEAERNGAE